MEVEIRMVAKVPVNLSPLVAKVFTDCHEIPLMHGRMQSINHGCYTFFLPLPHPIPQPNPTHPYFHTALSACYSVIEDLILQKQKILRQLLLSDRLAWQFFFTFLRRQLPTCCTFDPNVLLETIVLWPRVIDS